MRWSPPKGVAGTTWRTRKFTENTSNNGSFMERTESDDQSFPIAFPGVIARPFAGGAGHAVAFFPVFDHFANRLRQRHGIALRYDTSFHTVAHHGTCSLGRDNRQPAGQSLVGRFSRSFGERRQHEDIGSSKF